MRSRSMSARSVSAWELTETYSPAAIDMAPATSPATPATRISWLPARAAATPTTRLAVDTMPSLAPSTDARSQPTRCVRCRSRWLRVPPPGPGSGPVLELPVQPRVAGLEGLGDAVDEDVGHGHAGVHD